MFYQLWRDHQDYVDLSTDTPFAVQANHVFIVYQMIDVDIRTLTQAETKLDKLFSQCNSDGH